MGAIAAKIAGNSGGSGGGSSGITIGTTTSDGTANVLLKTSATGKVANSTVTDNGTTVSTRSTLSLTGSGTVSAPQLNFGTTTTGLWQEASTAWYIVYSGVKRLFLDFASNYIGLDQGASIGWGSSGDASASPDLTLSRKAAGVAQIKNATGVTSYLGGGASVASATALPVPTGSVFHVTGTTSVTSMTATGLQSGVMVTLIFDDVLTFTDGNNLKLAGNFVTTADDTITLVYDGTNFYEVCRSVN